MEIDHDRFRNSFNQILQVISLPTYQKWKKRCISKKRVDYCLALEIKMYKEIGGLNMYGK